MNKTASLEWLTIAYHDFKSAQILYEANHYTDSIGNDLQQSIEKSLKAILAFKNEKIPKTHDLYELYILINILNFEDEEITYLYIATEYFKEDSYPNPNYCLPPRSEIKIILDFTEDLIEKICKLLKINKEDICQ